MKVSKNEDSLDVLLNNFVNKPSFINLYVLFFEEWSIDLKSAVTFEKCPLVDELKVKNRKSTIFFTISISALPPEGVIEL